MSGLFILMQWENGYMSAGEESTEEAVDTKAEGPGRTSSLHTNEKHLNTRSSLKSIRSKGLPPSDYFPHTEGIWSSQKH